MHRLLALIMTLTMALALLLVAGAPAARGQGPEAGTTRKYPVGWNIVAIPPGTDFPIATTVLTAQPGDTDYEQLQPAQEPVSGFGYWAYVQGGDQSGYSKPVTLDAGSTAPYSVLAPPGDWILVGNPSGLLQATIRGADAALTFDPLQGYQLTTVLQPGEGAWAAAANGGSITVTPTPPSALPRLAPAYVAMSGPAPAVATPAAPSGPAVISLLPDPISAIEPASFWSWWPFPPPYNGPFLYPWMYPWTSSPPLSSPFTCRGYIVTAFALNHCGSLIGYPNPAFPAIGPFAPGGMQTAPGATTTGTTTTGSTGGGLTIGGGIAGPPAGCVSITGGQCITACNDGTFSSETGPGTCSSHGGEVCSPTARNEGLC